MILNRKLNPYASSIVLTYPLRSDLKSRTTAVADATIARTGTGHYRTGNGIISSVTANNARFETRGVLLEQASTNALTYSNDISNVAWSLLFGAPTITSGQTDPKGGTTAFKVVCDGPTVFSQATGAASTNAVSIWLRADMPITIGVGTGVGSFTSFDLNSTWTKYSHVNTEDGFILGSLALAAGDTLYVWNPQAEISAFSTTDIITAGSTGTRGGDVISLPSGIIPAVSNNFAIAADVIVNNTPAASMDIFRFVGETNGRILAIGNDLNISVSYGGSTTATVTPPITAGQRARILFTGNNSAYKCYVNGVQVLTAGVGGSGSHTSIKINNTVDGTMNMRDIIGYNRYFSTAAEALAELKYH